MTNSPTSGAKRSFSMGPQILEEFRLNLQTFINICRARKITPVLLTQFNRYKADPDPKIREAMAGLREGFADFRPAV